MGQIISKTNQWLSYDFVYCDQICFMSACFILYLFFFCSRYSNAVTEIGNRFVHLTNYSINKHNKEDDTGVENHKW